MKKISVFLALFLLAGLSKTFAGYLQVVNITNCNFELYSGSGTITDPSTTPPTNYLFAFNGVHIPPGTTMFANPTQLTGFSSNAPTALWSSGCVVSTKANGPSSSAFFISKTAPNTMYSSTVTPSCNGGNIYTVSWNTGSNGCDAVILIW